MNLGYSHGQFQTKCVFVKTAYIKPNNHINWAHHHFLDFGVTMPVPIVDVGVDGGGIVVIDAVVKVVVVVVLPSSATTSTSTST